MINSTARHHILKILKSQNQENTRLPAVLRYFDAPPEIKEIIRQTKDAPELQNSIRMFVITVSGEQTLITFSIPEEDCTIQDILKQVGVPFQPETKIAATETDRDGINLVVSVGFDADENETVETEETSGPNSPAGESAEQKPPTPELVASEQELVPYQTVLVNVSLARINS